MTGVHSSKSSTPPVSRRSIHIRWITNGADPPDLSPRLHGECMKTEHYQPSQNVTQRTACKAKPQLRAREGTGCDHLEWPFFWLAVMCRGAATWRPTGG